MPDSHQGVQDHSAKQRTSLPRAYVWGRGVDSKWSKMF